MSVSEEKFSEYYRDRFQEQLNWYERRANHYKRIEALLSIIAFISAILTPVSIAVLPYSYRAIPIVLSVGLVICLAISRIFNFGGRWLNYISTAQLLRREAILYQSAAGEYGNSEKAHEAFIDKIESIISKEKSLWLTTLAEKK
jgi:hypothetical protein